MFCVRGSVDILVVKAKARVLRDLLVAKREVNVGSSFSTFYFFLTFSSLFSFSLSTMRCVGGGEKLLNLSIVRLFTFNVLRRFPPIAQTLLLFFVFTNFVTMRFLRFLLLRLRVH